MLKLYFFEFIFIFIMLSEARAKWHTTQAYLDNNVYSLINSVKIKKYNY